MASKKRGLGRGLDALFADAAPVIEERESAESSDSIAGTDSAEKSADTADEDRIYYIDINEIKPNPGQPRRKFDETSIRELAESIEQNGLIQPIIVQKKNEYYELVAGERRWRAARIAGLRKIPCIIREFDEKQNLIIAIIENMQREDLDPMEEAAGLQQMLRKFGFTQEQVSNTLGKSRAYIANSVRLLKLPENIQRMVSDGRISAAHGRTLLAVEDPNLQEMLARRVEKEGLSVRTLEDLVKKLRGQEGTGKPERKKPEKSPEVAAVEDEFREMLGTKVSIVQGKKRGRIEIDYYSPEELNRLIDILRTMRKS